MKKFLITGGMLFAIMPAMALDLTDMYVPGDTDDCSGTEFQNNSVTMQAIYVTDSCPAGYYFNVGANAVVDSTTGQITGASCQPCTNGHYCSGVADITLGANNSLTSQGETACPTGYTDGGTGITSEANCVKTVDAAYCASLNLCSNFNNIITSGNKACATSVNTNNSNIVNGAITYGSGNTEPLCVVNKTCQPGYTTMNMYAWMAAHLGSITSPAVICSPDGTGTGCATMEPGTATWNLTGSDKPMNELHFATKCSDTSFDFGNPSSVIAGSISSDEGRYCWLKNTDMPNQPWFAFFGYADSDGCASACGDWWEQNPDYMFGSVQNGSFTPSANSTNIPYLLNGLTSVTNGQNGHPTADVCVASEITINWGVDENEQNITTTCTYGEGNEFTAPTTTPEPPADGLKFIGWRISPANNNN